MKNSSGSFAENSAPFGRSEGFVADDPRWLGITNRERIVGTQNDPVRACDIAQKTRRLRFEQHTKCSSTFRHRAPAASALPLVLSRVHWVRPELVAEVKYLTWTDDNLLGRSFTRVCVRKPAAAEVRPESQVRKRLPAGGGSLLRTRLGSEKFRISGGFWMIPEP